MKGLTPQPPPVLSVFALAPVGLLRAMQVGCMVQGYDNSLVVGRYRVFLALQGHTLEGSSIGREHLLPCFTGTLVWN